MDHNNNSKFESQSISECRPKSNKLNKKMSSKDMLNVGEFTQNIERIFNKPKQDS